MNNNANIKFFEHICNDDRAGGKGLSLSNMQQNNFNIPNGFIILSDEFDNFISTNSINVKIKCIVEKIQIDNEDNIKESSNTIYNLIDSCEINKELKQEIISSYRKLDTKYVAIRSSAICEDSKENAWAGQLDSFIFIDESNIIPTIKEVWKSLFSPRALYYCIKNNISNNSIAVIVQKMINSDTSGVAFSIDPIKNDSNTIVIEAIEGLGELIVSGQVTPDNYKIDKDNFTIKSKVINKQLEKKYLDNDVLRDKTINNILQKINDNTIIELSKIVKNIEQEYGYSVDVEWAIENDNIYILQARPITTKANRTQILLNKIIEKSNWEFLWLREFCWFVENTEVYATQKEFQEKYLGFEIATKNRLCINGDEYVLNNDAEYENEKLEQYTKDTNFWSKFVERDFEIEKETLNYIEFLKKKDYSILSDDKLLEEFKLFNDAYIKSFVPAIIIPEDYIYNEVIKLLSNKGFNQEKINKIISEVAKCPNHDKIYYNDEPLDLLKIALKKANNENINDDLIKHIDEYAWLKDPCIVDNVSFSKEEYIERIDTLLQFDIEKRISEISLTRKENDESLDKATKDYNLDQETYNMLKVLRDFTFLHTYIAQNTDHLFYTARHTLFKEIEKRTRNTR